MRLIRQTEAVPRPQAHLLIEMFSSSGVPASGLVLLGVAPDAMDEIAALRDLVSASGNTQCIRMESDALADQHGLIMPPAILVTRQGIQIEAQLCENGEAVHSPKISHDQLLEAVRHEIYPVPPMCDTGLTHTPSQPDYLQGLHT